MPQEKLHLWKLLQDWVFKSSVQLLDKNWKMTFNKEGMFQEEVQI